jgi:hypothetical protein
MSIYCFWKKIEKSFLNEKKEFLIIVEKNVRSILEMKNEIITMKCMFWASPSASYRRGQGIRLNIWLPTESSSWAYS